MLFVKLTKWCEVFNKSFNVGLKPPFSTNLTSFHVKKVSLLDYTDMHLSKMA